jgi:hypothetical protein
VPGDLIEELQDLQVVDAVRADLLDEAAAVSDLRGVV